MGPINAGYELGLQYPSAVLAFVGFCLVVLALAVAYSARTKK